METSEIIAAVARRHGELCRALEGSSADQLEEASLLPGWSRETIVSHLRYGAVATKRITEATIAGKPSAFYPRGRDVDRPRSLHRNADETAGELIASLRDESTRLEGIWHQLGSESWELMIEEPSDNPDLGPISLRHLAILRLTEVEVHGTDLDLDLGPWSATFVELALPLRVRWLTSRRSNHGGADSSVSGRWHLVPTAGPSFVVEANADGVQVHEQTKVSPTDVVFEGRATDLLAFLLGRIPMEDLAITGDLGRAADFQLAFPPP